MATKRTMRRGEGKAKAMIVAGVMSGTSADGVDVALVRIAPGRDEASLPKIKLLGHSGFQYAPEVRAAVMAAMNAGETSVRELARLNWRLGEVYAECVEEACRENGVACGEDVPGRTPKLPRLLLVGMHGQTLYHQTAAEAYAGVEVRATWQTGEPAVVAERLGLPVVSNFRSADLAAGGQGAPLVPMLDFCMFRSKRRSRVLLNLGGIANMTAIPAGGALEDVIAFDSGPANMVVDALMWKLHGRTYDCGGKSSAKGKVLEPVLKELLGDPYFAMLAPKSCGREDFGVEFADRLYSLVEAASGTKADALATATALTWRSVYDAYARIVWPHLGVRAPMAEGTDLIVAGGGARNAWMMRNLREQFTALGVSVTTSDEMGMPAEAKEGVAFALLAWLSWHGLPGNVPSATGASRPVVLGRVTC